jgi:DNA-binding Lrp family transcriptional regulator
MRLSTLDRKILNCIQRDISFNSNPFKALSVQLKIKEAELLRRLRRLKQRGIIRSFAAHLDHKKLGFASSLIGLRVSQDRVEYIARRLIDFPEITHCYLREGEYNLWAVFICSNKRRLKGFLTELAQWIGPENILNLPTMKRFKLKTRLEI